MAVELSTLGMTVRIDTTLQAGRQQTQYFDPFLGTHATANWLEARLNVYGQCIEAWCSGTNIVLHPRLYTRSDNQLPAGISERPSWLPEAYVVHSTGQNSQFGAGKRLMGWGPGLLYSPSNRLFPDNGAVSPRREIPGKLMAFGSTSLPGRGQGTFIVADPREQSITGTTLSGTFIAARSEWQQEVSQTSTLGIVAAGGGSLAPYLGLYGQRGVTDALTLGIEASVSRKYANSATESQLTQNDGNAKWDMLANVRYGLASGGEIGVEFIRNGYNMSDAEQANPFIAALPSAGSTPTWNRPLHPLVQRQYALLQFTAPSLFGNKCCGIIARILRGLDQSSTDHFLELSWSVNDAITLYAGYAQSRVPIALQMTRPVTHSAYLTLESFF